MSPFQPKRESPVYFLSKTCTDAILCASFIQFIAGFIVSRSSASPLTSESPLQTFFTSHSHPAQAAKRLAHLLPALSLPQAQDWTAQVFGYRNWCELRSEVEKAILRAARKPAPSRSSESATPSWSKEEEDQYRTDFQREVLSRLMGGAFKDSFGLNYEWKPNSAGAVKRVQLARPEMGYPAMTLVRENLFAAMQRGPTEGLYEYCDDNQGQVLRLFPARVNRREAVAAFVAKLPKSFTEADRAALADELMSYELGTPALVKKDGESSLAQVFGFKMLAFDRADRLIGVACASFDLTASLAGSHGVKISVNRVAVLKKDGETLFSLGSAVYQMLSSAVQRYLWSTVGNADQAATVLVCSSRELGAETEVANTIKELLIDSCDLDAEVVDRRAAKGIRLTQVIYL